MSCSSNESEDCVDDLVIARLAPLACPDRTVVGIPSPELRGGVTAGSALRKQRIIRDESGSFGALVRRARSTDRKLWKDSQTQRR